MILIAGIGGTAHAFDDFAPLLTPHFHVYAITRRGYGISSRPPSGYGVDRLGEDVVAVIHARDLKKPILMGHSFGGQELSDVATRYPLLVSGIIYLDAVYSYDPELEKRSLYWNVEWKQQINALQKHLTELLKAPGNPSEVASALSKELPAVQGIAENLVRVEKVRPPWVNPQDADLASFAALSEWYRRAFHGPVPESELRQEFVTLPDGRPSMDSTTPSWVSAAVEKGRKSFHQIPVPALYIAAEENTPAAYDKDDPEGRANAEAYMAYQHGWLEYKTSRFEADAPKGKLVVLQGATHFVFASNAQDVVRESFAFAASLEH